MGLRLSSGQTTWMKDTNYFVYGQDPAKTDWVSVAVRDDVIALKSSLGEGTKVLASSVTTDRIENWLKTWSARIDHLFQHGNLPLSVFISKRGRRIIIVNHRNRRKKNKYVTISPSGEKDIYMVSLSPKLMQEMYKPLKLETFNKIPFRLTFLHS